MLGIDSFNTVLSFLFLHSISIFIFLYPTINKDQINKINKYYWSIKFCISYWKCCSLICNISRNYNSICRPSQNKIIFTVIFTGISIVLQKLLKYFNETIISTSFVPIFPVWSVICSLKLILDVLSPCHTLELLHHCL